MSDDTDNRPSAIATPADLAEAHKATIVQEHLRDDFVPKVDRAIAAELAGKAWDFAGLVGVDVPPQIKQLIDALAFFGPLAKHLAGYEASPQWFKDGFEKVLEGADLARRAID